MATKHDRQRARRRQATRHHAARGLRRRRRHGDRRGDGAAFVQRLDRRVTRARRRRDRGCAADVQFVRSEALARNRALRLSIHGRRRRQLTAVAGQHRRRRRRCFSEAEARQSATFADGSLHLDAVAVDATPAAAGVAAWDETGERFIAWHCVVTPRADGRWSGARDGRRQRLDHRQRRRRSPRLPLRRLGGDAIDANIAHPGEYADVDRALVAQNFLIVPGGESCPRDPPTEQHQP